MKDDRTLTRDDLLKDGFGQELIKALDSCVSGSSGSTFRYLLEEVQRSEPWRSHRNDVFDLIGFEVYLRLRKLYEGRRLDLIEKDMNDRIVAAVAVEKASRL